MRHNRAPIDVMGTRTIYPSQVYLAGISMEDFQSSTTAKLNLPITQDRPVTVSTEVKQQMQDRAKQDALLSLFVYKPRQTGFGHVAEMTAAAINDPDNTTVVVLEPGDDTTADDRVQRADVLDVLSNTNASIYTNMDEAVAHVNQRSEDGMEAPISFKAEEQV